MAGQHRNPPQNQPRIDRQLGVDSASSPRSEAAIQIDPSRRSGELAGPQPTTGEHLARRSDARQHRNPAEARRVALCSVREGSIRPPLGTRLRHFRPTGSVESDALLGRSSIERDHIAGAQRIEIIAPAGHHHGALIAKVRPVVGTPVHVPNIVVELRLDPLDALA